MAIDTPTKRRSAANLKIIVKAPTPVSPIDAEHRRDIAWLYNGFAITIGATLAVTAYLSARDRVAYIGNRNYVTYLSLRDKIAYLGIRTRTAYLSVREFIGRMGTKQ